MTTNQSETLPYLEAFRRRGGEPQWLAARRQAALDAFAGAGFPSRRQEAWRFTDLRPLQRTAFLPDEDGAEFAAPDLGPWRVPGQTHRIVLVNGRFAPDLSDIGALPAGAWLGPTARALSERPDLAEAAFEASDAAGGQPFAALNAAFFTDGFVLALEPGVELALPLEVLHLGRAHGPCSFHVRSAVVLGEGSRARLVESFAGEGPYWTNGVVAVSLAAGASLDHVRLQDDAAEAIHVALSRAALGRAARYRAFSLTLGARLSRLDLVARIEGAEASCGLDGGFLLRGDQEATTATFVDHAAPGGVTRELFKGVVEDRAHGVFLGRIAVRGGAQKSDAQQVNRNLLLSRRAAVDTKPELEILADDVKCSHGATVGDLDEDALFYLRARGIAEPEARRLLVEAFAGDALERVEDRVLREHLASHLGIWLARVGGGHA